MADVEQGEIVELLDVVELTSRVLESKTSRNISPSKRSQFELFAIQASKMLMISISV